MRPEAGLRAAGPCCPHAGQWGAGQPGSPSPLRAALEPCSGTGARAALFRFTIFCLSAAFSLVQ